MVSKISYNAVIVLSVVLSLLQANDSFVEIELLATVSWACGCQPFSCRCSQNVTHCRKELCWTCSLGQPLECLCTLRPRGLYMQPFQASSLFLEATAMLPWCREGRKAGNTGAKILVQSVRRRCQKRQEICKYGAKRYNFFAKPN